MLRVVDVGFWANFEGFWEGPKKGILLVGKNFTRIYGENLFKEICFLGD